MEKQDLDEFQFYLAPSMVQDLCHPELAFTGAAAGPEYLEMGVIVRSQIGPNVCLLKSPVLMSIERTDGQDCQASQLAMGMIGMAILRGVFRPDHPDFNERLRLLFELIQPRRSNSYALDFQEFLLLYSLKIMRNTIKSQTMLRLLGLGSWVNHSCAPNLGLSIDPVLNEVCFTSLRTILPEEHACFSYIPWPIDERTARDRLLHFHCNCLCCRTDRRPSLILVKQKVCLRDQTLHCWSCGAGKPTRQCRLCSVASYCSSQCQKLNRSTHKKLCADIAMQPRLGQIEAATLIPREILKT